MRAANGIADHYLRRRDRVGLIAFGGSIRWLVPSMGLGQSYRIVDTLIGAQAAASFVWKGVDLIPPRSLPAKALVIALTPLVDVRTVEALLDLRGRGFDLAIIEVSPEALLPPPDDDLARNDPTALGDAARAPAGPVPAAWRADRGLVIRSVAGGGARGGSSISTTRPTRARLIAALLAFGVGLVIARLSLDLRTGALLFVSGTRPRRPRDPRRCPRPREVTLIGAAQTMFALLYLGHVVLAGESTWEALGLVSLGVLLVGELSQWSFDSRIVGRYEAGLHQSRAVGIAALWRSASGSSRWPPSPWACRTW